MHAYHDCPHPARRQGPAVTLSPAAASLLPAPMDATPPQEPDDFIPGWYAIASSRELRSTKPLAVERFGQRWVIFRHAKGVAVLRDRCPHRAVALSGGRVRGECIVCPFHGFEFGADGACKLIPAQPSLPIPKTMCTPSLRALEQHDYVFAWWGPEPDELPKVDWFSELEGCAGPYEFAVDTNTGLSRNIENQLDFTHLPFVHASSIGRFIQDPAMEVETAVDNNRIRAFLQGQPDGYVELRLPNLWINQIGKRTFVSLAFVPLTRERTRLYARYYQGRFRVPLLRDLHGWFMTWGNRWILGQDIRVVDTHQPAVSPALDGSEVLLKSDAPIIAYRRARERAHNAERS